MTKNDNVYIREFILYFFLFFFVDVTLFHTY